MGRNEFRSVRCLHSESQSTTVHGRLLHPHLRCCSSPASAVRRLYAISCSYRDTGVRCSVVGPFLWPARRPGTRYQTTCEISHVPLTVFAATWKLFFLSFLVLLAYTAHERLCDYAPCKSTIDVDIDIDTDQQRDRRTHRQTDTQTDHVIFVTSPHFMPHACIAMRPNIVRNSRMFQVIRQGAARCLTGYLTVYSCVVGVTTAWVTSEQR